MDTPSLLLVVPSPSGLALGAISSVAERYDLTPPFGVSARSWRRSAQVGYGRLSGGQPGVT